MEIKELVGMIGEWFTNFKKKFNETPTHSEAYVFYAYRMCEYRRMQAYQPKMK